MERVRQWVTHFLTQKWERGLFLSKWKPTFSGWRLQWSPHHYLGPMFTGVQQTKAAKILVFINCCVKSKRESRWGENTFIQISSKVLRRRRICWQGSCNWKRLRLRLETKIQNPWSAKSQHGVFVLPLDGVTQKVWKQFEVQIRFCSHSKHDCSLTHLSTVCLLQMIYFFLIWDNVVWFGG